MDISYVNFECVSDALGGAEWKSYIGTYIQDIKSNNLKMMAKENNFLHIWRMLSMYHI